MPHTSIVVTSIFDPNAVILELARGSEAYGYRFVLIGDSKGPSNVEVQGCDFYSLDRQRNTGLRLAESCPVGHYARKNVGFLIAMRDSALIVETDDDNMPLPGFWTPRQRSTRAKLATGTGWLNAYSYFSDGRIWPRGFALDQLQSVPPPFESLPTSEVNCPIQQGLVDGNPDVDAIFRLVSQTQGPFRADRRLACGPGAWCPFNSQNTTWWREAFPLLYLPAYCSFRMPDIWRSFIGQRIAWENDWAVLFHEATVFQSRNAHDLMKDFADEIPGYLHNRVIVETLEKAPLRSGEEHISQNMLICYESLVARGVLPREELALLADWLHDVSLLESRTARQEGQGLPSLSTV